MGDGIGFRSTNCWNPAASCWSTRQLRYVPGRKTDLQDCQWIQLLHSCGLLRGSFRPHEVIVRVRTLHRQLSTLGAESTRFVQWMQKALDQMNVQIHRAVTGSDRSNGDGDRAGDRRRTGPGPSGGSARQRRCKKSSREFAEQRQLARRASVQPQVGAEALRHDSTRDRGL